MTQQPKSNSKAMSSLIVSTLVTTVVYALLLDLSAAQGAYGSSVLIQLVRSAMGCVIIQSLGGGLQEHEQSFHPRHHPSTTTLQQENRKQTRVLPAMQMR